MIQQDNSFMWEQFCRLGEMMGDGLHYEPDGKWIPREYRRLYKILCPPSDEEKKVNTEKRKEKNLKIDGIIKTRIDKDNCNKCQSNLRQVRSGSTVVQCINEECKTKYKYGKKKK